MTFLHGFRATRIERSVSVFGLGLSLVFAGACGSAEIENSGDGGPNGNYGGDGGLFPDPDNTCEALAINAQKGIPNILVVLDRSGSMDDDNRWDQAVPAIQSVTANLGEGIAFGLEMYPSGDGGRGSSQCTVANGPDVMPATGMADEIANVLNASGPGGRTPTASALGAAKAALQGLSGSSYVLLVTDGAPNCNTALDPQTCTCSTGGGGGCDAVSCLDDAGSVAAVQALKDAGIPTYVIGFDTQPAWEQVLTNMAAAGGTGQTYFPVTDGTTLTSALANLAGNVVSCSYQLETAPSDAGYVKVVLDGKLVTPMTDTQDGSGWELIGKNVELRGSTCEYVKNNPDAKLAISRECELLVY